MSKRNLSGQAVGAVAMAFLLIAALLPGCNRGVSEKDILGTWHAYFDREAVMAQVDSEFEVNAFSDALLDLRMFTLEIHPGGRFTFDKWFSSYYGDWELEEGVVHLQITGYRDGTTDEHYDELHTRANLKLQLQIQGDGTLTSEDNFISDLEPLNADSEPTPLIWRRPGESQ